jgi:hypothetical protein
MTVSELPPVAARGTVQEQLDELRVDNLWLRNQVNFLVAKLERVVSEDKARKAPAQPARPGRHLSVARPS